MQWLILKDLINKPGNSEGITPRVGVGDVPRQTRDAIRALPKEAVDPFLQGLTKDWSDEFRLKDDDGEVYYVGRCDGLDDACEESAFAPLDYAMADAGCTSMEYRKVGTAEWKVL